MTTKTIECVECGQPVPNGRLSCPACGALRAAVSRSRRAPTPPAPPPAATSAYLIDPAKPTGVEPEPDDWQPPWPPLQAADPVLVARPYGRAGSMDGTDSGIAAPPGAYLPPRLAPSLAMAGGADRSWTMPAGGAGGVPGARVVAGAGRAGGAGGAAAVSSTEEPASATSATPDVDAARLVEIAGWFVVVGSAMSALGFLLPWSWAVIGARGSGGYLDQWGLASASHILVLGGLLAVLALGVVRTAVPAWIRTGVLGLGVGGLLLGLTWPYVFGPLGSEIGVLVVALGAVALVIGGGVASWATRHAGTDPVV